VVSCVECEMWTLTRTEMGGKKQGQEAQLSLGADPIADYF
jgi:hypothetical protein